MKKIDHWLGTLQRQVERPFYFVLLALMAFADSFVFFIPTDGLLVTSVYAHPKAWFRNALGTTVGSVVGSLLFAKLIQIFGLGLLHYFYPNIESSSSWLSAVHLMAQYGHYAIFLIALTPFPQPPIIALAALGNMSLMVVGLMLFSGRVIKYLLLSRIVAKSPELMDRIRGIQKEVAAAKKISNS